MTTLKEAKKLLNSVKRNEYNKKPFDAAKSLIEEVSIGWKSEEVLKSVEYYIKDCKRLDESALKISESLKPKAFTMLLKVSGIN